jgi:phosphotriesterase-related protein
MAEITTVLGPIAPTDLGFTSMHEHTVCDMSIFRKRYEFMLPENLPVAADDPIKLDNMGILKHVFILSRDVMDLTDEELMCAEMSYFVAAGGRAIVDMSVPGTRCDIASVKRISEKTGVHIIATTGLYMEDSWPERFSKMTIKGYMEFMHREIEDGIEDTGVKPGHIKVAITDSTMPGVQPFSEQQKKLLKAAVRVSNETGLSLSVHPPLDLEQNVREVVNAMIDEGVAPDRCVIAHSDLFFAPRELKTLVMNPDSWRLKVDLAKEHLDRGLNISIDSFGHYFDAEPLGGVATNDWQRLAGIVALVRMGYSSQIVLGTDIFLKIQTCRYGGEGYCRLTNYVVPSLRQMEVSEADIHKMTVDNPARILSH